MARRLGDIKEFGFHRTRTDCCHEYAPVFQLRSQRAAVTEHKGLGGRVDGKARLWQKGRGGSKLKDAAVLSHIGQNHVGHRTQRLAVDLNHAGLILQTDISHIADFAVTGGVDQQLHIRLVLLQRHFQHF